MIRQIRIQPQRALIWGALLLGGAGLITISYLAPDRYEAMVPTIAAEARPSATWAPLPTRALNDASTLAVDPDLGVLHRAILSGDLRAAEVMWEALQDAGLGQTAEIQVAGARIALLQGDTVTAESRVWEAIGLEPTNAEIWSLLGVISRTAGDTKGADEALSIAVGLEPSLSGDLLQTGGHLLRHRAQRTNSLPWRKPMLCSTLMARQDPTSAQRRSWPLGSRWKRSSSW